MLKQVDFVKYKKAMSLIFVMALFLCCLYALHDMQTAQGIGLLFSMKLGMDDRMVMDVAVDVLAMFVFAMLIYLPCVKLQHKSVGAFLRLLIGYMAVVPQLSLASVLALIQRYELEFWWDVGLWSGLWKWFYSAISFLQVWVPVLVILAALAKANDCLTFVKWHKIILLIQGILLVVLLCMPSAENVILYLCGYLGVLLAFDCWERLMEANAKLARWFSVPFALLFLRGIYRILSLVSQV